MSTPIFRKTLTNLASALCAFALVVALFEQVFFKDNEPPPDDTQRSAQPEWYVENAKLWSFNEMGQRVQTATAETVRYFKEEDIAYLNAPRVTSYTNPDESPWRSKADFGQFSEDFNILELRKNVSFIKGSKEVTMTTQHLILNRLDNTAETSKLVFIKSPASETRGVGMHAWLDDQKVELLAKVRTVHEPQ